MASPYFWNQFGIHRHKIIGLFAALLLLMGINALAQPRPLFKKNLPNHDRRVMHYGMHFGLHASRFVLQHSEYHVQRNDTMVNPKFGPGFNVGFVVNRRLTDFIDIRLVPGFVFSSSLVEFKPAGDAAPVERTFGATTFDIPLLLRFKSLRRGNTRMYFVGGAKTSVDFGNKKKASSSSELEITNQDFAIQYGVGLDLFYPFFKFSPEIRFSNGLINRYAPASNAQSRRIQGMFTNSVTLYLNIEN